MGRDAVLALADLVLPRTCAGCGVPGAVLCPRCAALLARPTVAAPRRVPWGFPPTAAAGAYAGPVRPAVVAFKERGRSELAVPLGAALALAVAAVVRAVPDPPRQVLLVPVPSSRQGLR
ncbi:UNVERIFIED_ORG: ComF family protein, partial [Bacillus sp. AZ43]